MTTTQPFTPTERTQLHRLKDRGSYDRELIYRILDDGLVCHVGFVAGGRPFVIPTGYARLDDSLILHGSVASRMMGALRQGVDVCATVTLLDGLVLARSAFHHSMNYRSVVVFGKAEPIVDDAKKRRALDALVEHLIPGRTRDARGAAPKELAATEVLALPLTEASAKVRTGPPHDERRDLGLPVWAGVLPFHLAAGAPLPAEDLEDGVGVPDYVRSYARTLGHQPS